MDQSDRAFLHRRGWRLVASIRDHYVFLNSWGTQAVLVFPQTFQLSNDNRKELNDRASAFAGLTGNDT